MDKKEIENLIDQIDGLLEHIKSSAAWIDSFLRKDKSYLTVINIRRRLKKIRYALLQNPSAALFGESQVGKSYLIKNLLSLPKKEFIIKDLAENSREFNFLEEINPAGGGAEATSVVTRFSTNVEVPDKSYPIVVKVLSAKDIALILIDSCLSELGKSLQFINQEEIRHNLEQLQEQYQAATNVQDKLTEDHFLDIQDYIEEHFPSSIICNSLKDAGFWKIAPRLVGKMPSQDWDRLLGLIWANNANISSIFNKLIRELEKIGYVDKAYTKMETVLREHGTLLDVNRLHELTGQKEAGQDAKGTYLDKVELLVLEGGERRVVHTTKGYLCALTSELIFSLEKSLEDHKPFLKNLDLLDFPGARARLEIGVGAIEGGMSNLLLRGKVAYIFNKFSNEFLISNLLFCNKSGQIEATYIPRLLNNWIEKYIGKTPQEREQFLSRAKVPPFFVIYTWFNADLMYSHTNDKDPKSLESKWAKRFNRIFEGEIVTSNYNWDKNWTTSQPFFQNQYMLRDLRLSEEKSNLFKGFSVNTQEVERIEDQTAYNNDNNNSYWEDMETSFVNFPFVKNHFPHPQKTWEETATLNKDGAEPIIRNLSYSAESQVRTKKFNKLLLDSLDGLEEEMRKHYHTDEADKRILKAVQKAGNIQVDFDIAFGKEPYVFGKFIDKFLVSESEIFNFYHEKLNDIELIEKSNLSVYAPIRLANQKLSINASFEENVAVLQNTYKYATTNEVIDHFEQKEIDLNMLFYGQANLIKSNSMILAEGLIDFWFDQYLQVENFEEFESQGIRMDSISDLIDNIKANIDQLNLREYISEKIRKYVDRYDKIEKLQEMIADISAALINKFVNSMGSEFYTERELKNIEKTNEENGLNLTMDHTHLSYQPLNEDELKDLFERLDILHELLNKNPIDSADVKNVPGFSHFKKWMDQLKVSFVASCDIPTYDIAANNELGKIVNALDNFSFENVPEE